MFELVWRKTRDKTAENLYITTECLSNAKIASAWENGTWHTWHPITGTGGENAVAADLHNAKTMALGSAIEQGFVECLTVRDGLAEL